MILKIRGIGETISNIRSTMMLFACGAIGAASASADVSNGRDSKAIVVSVASRSGAVLDSNTETGGGTDDTAAIQSILDKAKNGSRVHLVVDGPALVRGLDVYSNTTIECIAGAGFFLRDQSSRAVIRNAHRSRDSRTDSNISVKGCFINGNRDNQLHKDPTDNENQEADGTPLAGIEMFGVKDVTLEHLALRSIRAFAIYFSNADHIVVEDVRIDDGRPRDSGKISADEAIRLLKKYANTDGVHLHGPIHNAIVDGLVAHTGDDVLALTANDMAIDMTIHNDYGPYVGQGPITDVVARNISFDDAEFGIRLLSANQPIDRILIQNVTGNVRNRVAVVSHWIIPNAAGEVGSISFENIDARPSGTSAKKLVEDNGLSLSDEEKEAVEQDAPVFSFNSPINVLRLEHISTKVIDQRPLIRLGPDAAIRELSADIDVIASDLHAGLIQVDGGHIERLSWILRWDGRGVESVGSNLHVDVDRIKRP